MKKQTTGVFVIYSRKSKFTGKGESVENQVEMCRNYISTYYSQEEADRALVYEDEGFSGGNLERPQFKQMMKDSHKQKFAAIVVYRLDRISRNIGDFAKLIEELGDRNIDFISIREQFDTSSPMGRAMMYIASVFSQLERETIAERIRDNMHELAKTGRWLGGVTPTGFASEGVTKVSVDGKVRKAYQLKAIPEEIAVVQKIFDLFQETGSLTKVDQYLLERQFKTKNGRDYTRFTIRSILTNPVYLRADEDAYKYMVDHEVSLFSDRTEFDGIHGLMVYNRTLQRPGKPNQLNPMNEWIVSVGKHVGVISGAHWVAVQGRLDRNKNKAYRTARVNEALLSGLIFCGCCGSRMRPKMTQRTNSEGELVYTYMCEKKERSCRQVCAVKNVSGNVLDDKVIEVLRTLGENSDEMAEQIAKVKQMLTGNHEGYEAEKIGLQAKLKKNEASIKSLVEALSKASGTSAESYIMTQIDELDRAGKGARKRLAELETVTAKNRMVDMEFDLLRQMLADFGRTIDTCSVEQKRAAVRMLVKRVVWDGDTVHLYLFGHEGEIEFPEISTKNDKNGLLVKEVAEKVPNCDNRK